VDFNEARDDGVGVHQLDHMQIICTSLRQITMPVIDHSVFTGRMPFDYYYYNHFYGSLDFVRHNPGELVPGETFTH